LNRAIELDPENDYAYASRGQTYRKTGDFLKAIVDFNKALELDPDYTWVIEKRDELYKEMEGKTEATPKSIEKSRTELPLLSVMDFVIENVSESDGKLIVDILSSALIKIKKYRILDRSQRDTLIKELEFSYSDCTDETCQLELGRLLAADKIVVGSLGKVGNRYILNAKLLNVVTGEAVSSAYEIFKSIEDLVDGSEAVARELIRE
jgi:tetratricopeptide (TPR) repeat protein